jgi:hypothetical protein
MKKKATLQFLDQILEPILTAQKEGGILISVRKGSGKDSTLRTNLKMIHFLIFLCNDSSENFTMCGIKPGYLKCRTCEKCPTDYSDTGPPTIRHSKYYQFFHKVGEEAWIRKLLKQPLTPVQQEVLAHNQEYCVANIENPLHAHFALGDRNLLESKLCS